MTVFFYDSYAIIEYLNNNPRFVPYFEEHTGITSVFNLAEVYYSVLHDSGKEKADIALDTLSSLVVEVDKHSLKKSMLFRLLYKKRKLSYADCVGYELAHTHGVKFLTGDIQFKDIQNVEHVK